MSFQLTHPWGCDAAGDDDDDADDDFNSHTREGVTPIDYLEACKKLNFNSHTREGVTGAEWSCVQALDFNSHTREGVTSCSFLLRPQKYFNSHTREGVTSYLGADVEVSEFQLTHPWGCDQYKALSLLTPRGISTHTPVRVWPKA